MLISAYFHDLSSEAKGKHRGYDASLVPILIDTLAGTCEGGQKNRARSVLKIGHTPPMGICFSKSIDRSIIT